MIPPKIVHEQIVGHIAVGMVDRGKGVLKKR